MDPGGGSQQIGRHFSHIILCQRNVDRLAAPDIIEMVRDGGARGPSTTGAIAWYPLRNP